MLFMVEEVIRYKNLIYINEMYSTCNYFLDKIFQRLNKFQGDH
jgi:hypothetical protein